MIDFIIAPLKTARNAPVTYNTPVTIYLQYFYYYYYYYYILCLGGALAFSGGVWWQESSVSAQSTREYCATIHLLF